MAKKLWHIMSIEIENNLSRIVEINPESSLHLSKKKKIPVILKAVIFC